LLKNISLFYLGFIDCLLQFHFSFIYSYLNFKTFYNLFQLLRQKSRSFHALDENATSSSMWTNKDALWRSITAFIFIIYNYWKRWGGYGRTRDST